MVTGERVVAAGIGAFGALWAVQSSRLAYWSEFAPGSGFLPFWLGIILIVLSLAFLALSFLQPESDPPAAATESAGRGRVISIVLGLLACILVLEWIGFVAAITAYLLFLLLVVERRPLHEAAGVAAGTSFLLWLVFQHWLHVPLPAGPWGF